MISKITICTIALATILLPTAIISADDIVPPNYPPKVAYMLLANKVSAQYGVSAKEMKDVINCESSWNPLALKSTNREFSVGLSQINLKAHPDITVAQAQSPEFALTYLAKGLSTSPNMWSCYTQLHEIHHRRK